MKALILAGGFSRRLGPLGENIPKGVLVAEGDTVLNHLLRKLEAEGVETFISTNRRFESYFTGYRNVLVEEAMREEEKLGALSAVDYAIKKLNIQEDLLVACVDNYFSSDLRGFLSSYTGETLVGIYHAGRKPDVRLEEMATVRFEGCERYPPPERSFLLTDFKEKMKPPLSDYVGIGIYIFPSRIFPILNEFCGGPGRDAPGFFIQHLVERGERVRGYLFTGEWYDISHKSYLRIFSDARLVRSDERYVICDKSLSEKLVASITILHPGKQTTGHSHPGAEVYFFVEGEGEMEVDGNRQRVGSKDVVLVRPDQFHRVYNTGDKELIFVVAFEKYGERG